MRLDLLTEITLNNFGFVTMEAMKIIKSILCSVWVGAGLVSPMAVSGSEYDEVRHFISVNMPLSVRTNPVDTLGKLGLPYPYSVPCVKGMFQDMYYWDTYFTNLGLLSLGDVEQARNNTDNILSVIDRLGYMPNATFNVLLNRSQPPYAAMMVDDIYKVTGDRDWLAKAVPVLEKEYDFWMSERIAPNGLNVHGNSATVDELRDFYRFMTTRLPHLKWDIPDDERIRRGSHFLAEAESGWDFCPRFDFRCQDFNPVDLNANLYMYETLLSGFNKTLGDEKKSRMYDRLAGKRRKLMRQCMYDEKDGLYYDYDFVNRRRGDVYSSAVFNLMWAGLMSEKEARAVVSNLARLEMAHGVVACEPKERDYIFQWDAPNSWASFNVLAVRSLDKYGYKGDAERIARKYADSIKAIYEKTGNLWEKYNGVTCDIDVKGEYEMPPFMGWTAGAFMFMTDYLSVANPVFYK